MHLPSKGECSVAFHDITLTYAAQPVEKLSRERPLGYIFNVYVMSSILLQFSLHIAALVYITTLTYTYETSARTHIIPDFLIF